MAIYFVRHGESEANVKGIFAGQREDSPLTELGRQQAQEAGEGLRGLSFGKLYSSPLARAKETAEIIAIAIGFNPSEITYDDRIQEYDMGSLTGTPIKDVNKNRDRLSVDAEDKAMFQRRVLEFLREHKNDTVDVLMISHAGVGRAIETASMDTSPEQLHDSKPYPNAHAVKLEIDENTGLPSLATEGDAQ